MIDHQDHDSAAASAATEAPPCPKCQGPMWDNRESKRNPKAPDFKCRDKSCDGIIWPPRTANAGAAAAATPGGAAAGTAGAAGAAGAANANSPACPICGGPMWDDRASKRNPKAPDFKCKNKPKVRGGPGCEGVIWPPRDGQRSAYGSSSGASATSSAPPRPRASGSPSPYDAPRDYGPPPMNDAPPHDDDDLPF